MSTVKQCDRCKKYYKKNKLKGDNWAALSLLETIKICDENGRYDYELDLCDDCFEAFFIFLNPKEEESTNVN